MILKTMKKRLWAFSILLALGLWSRNIYVEYCPDLSSYAAKSDGWYGIGDCIFIEAFPMKIADKLVEKKELWGSASKFLLFGAALLGLWIVVDTIAPVLERIKKDE